MRQVRPHVADLLRRIPDAAAIVTDATYDVIAVEPARATPCWATSRAEPNLARRRFLGRPLRELERRGVRPHRGRAAARPPPTATPATSRSPACWQNCAPAARSSSRSGTPTRCAPPATATKTITHPQVGPLRLNCDVLAIPDDDQQVVFITADPGTPTARALRHLVPAG